MHGVTDGNDRRRRGNRDAIMDCASRFGEHGAQCVYRVGVSGRQLAHHRSGVTSSGSATMRRISAAPSGGDIAYVRIGVPHEHVSRVLRKFRPRS